MTDKDDLKNNAKPSQDWLDAELADTLDEDYELELSEPALTDELRKVYQGTHPETIERRAYFHNLLRLQSELIKLQDWVVHHKKKIVVVFEGRDSAGKGGVIKRISQRLNPRVCRTVALPAPKGSTNLTGRCGQAGCAVAGAANPRVPASVTPRTARTNATPPNAIESPA